MGWTSEATAAWNASPEGKARKDAYRKSPRAKAMAIARAATPEFKARAKELRDRPEAKAKVAAYGANPEYRAKLRAKASTPEAKMKQKDARLRSVYGGFTLVDHDAMIEAQGNRCALCGDPFGLGLHKTVTDHTTDADGRVIVRGILHHKCNVTLGVFGDDLAGVMYAVRYLVSAI